MRLKSGYSERRGHSAAASAGPPTVDTTRGLLQGVCSLTVLSSEIRVPRCRLTTSRAFFWARVAEVQPTAGRRYGPPLLAPAARVTSRQKERRGHISSADANGKSATPTRTSRR